MASQTASAPATDNNPAILRDTFNGVPLASHPEQWHSFYKQDFYPWDRAGPSLALADLLTQRSDLVAPAQERDRNGSPVRGPSGAVARRTALVPGCGRGHDVMLLSSFGYDTCGLDYSEDAVRMAEENRSTAEKQGRYKVAEGMEQGDISWASGDFFSDTWAAGKGTEGTGKFDVIFDYTFLCALPPEARPKWAKRMSQLLSPNGRLICLEFPSGKALSLQGPPWGLTPEVYEALLAAPGEVVTYDQDGDLVDNPNPKPHLNALQRLSLIKPSRTHKAGTNEDGSVSDFISVWAR